MVNDLKIENWTIYGAESIVIDLHKDIIDGTPIYNPTVGIFLDDGSNRKEPLHIGLIADKAGGENAALVAIQTANFLAQLFGKVILDEVLVYDTDGQLIDEESLSLNEVATEFEKLADIMEQENPETPRVLH